MLKHAIYGVHDDEPVLLCEIEARPGEYNFPARDVLEMKFDPEEFEPCFAEGDRAYWGKMGGNYDKPEYSIFFNIDKDGNITSFMRAQHLYFWYANRGGAM